MSIDDYAKKAAEQTGIDTDRFLGLITCESNWKEDAAGDHNRSFGILQFQKPTFARFSKKYNMESLDISDSYDQIDLAALMIRDGYQDNWLRCGRRVGFLQ
ncbi:MAG: transglycosylase SLT domain-containing protein [Candidatus Sungbacteria bacterium]|uniref:Transglycosylase SLT domain-containing protein n=1 Tax=Candidatus Sungiibacteriota bacterium TaxID=2750080 RepID=A0A932QXQ1_9BACT|nr:transglycosylase SLT domain-containing protein [Candidatus Sungbacteria bacterium]